jgi:signal transduction histidine kinase
MAGGRGDGTVGWLSRIRLLPPALIATLVGILFASVTILILSEITLLTSTQYAQQISDVLRRLEATAQVHGLIIDAETGQRGFLLTGDARYLEPFEQAVREFPRSMEQLRKLSPSPALRTQVDVIEETALARLGVASTSITLWETGEHANAIDIARSGRDKELTDQFRIDVDTLEEMSKRELRELRSRQGPAALRSRLATLISSLLAIGLLLTVTRLFIRQADFQRAEAERMQSLVDARTAELSELSSHLQEVSEREKAELARNLHDELGGLLTAARMDLSWLLGATQGLDPQIGEKLEQISQGLTESMDIKRRVVESLRPALLDHFGLSTAMQNYFEESCKKAGLNFTGSIPDDLPDLPQDLSIALFRVGQESLTNVIRHANAKNVDMSMAVVDDEVRVTVTDDGSGIDLDSPKIRNSHGISGMRHRIQALGGSFRLKSAPGNGTRLEISVPRVRPPLPTRFADAAP